VGHRGRAFAAVLCAVAGLGLITTGADAQTTYHGSAARVSLAQPIVDIAATPTGNGYWLVASDGGIFNYGDAKFYGSTGGIPLAKPIVGMTPTPSGRGYWLVAADGGIFNYGTARFYGSTGGMPLNRPIVGMTATPTGRGYWLVATDGGIFSFGDAKFYGSTGGFPLNRPIVGMASTPSGRGYWLVASDGGIFAFGDAKFYGSTGGMPLVSPITGMARTPRGRGYYLVAEDGGVFAFGGAKFYGSAANAAPQPTVDIAISPSGGYYIATQFGAVHAATTSGEMIIDPALAARTPSEAISNEIVARINAERRARGLQPVSWDPALADAAKAWAGTMAMTNSFHHQDIGALIQSPPIAGRMGYLSENIYSGTGGAADSGTAHAALMGSDGHRSTMLTPELQYIGVGAACVNGQLWLVEDFSIGLGAPMPPNRPTPPHDPFVSSDGNGSRCL